MRQQDKKRVLTGAVIIGLICIIMVVVTAYSAELRVENNKLISENEATKGEIDTLHIKIKSANNIEHIEKVATKKLGMVYPSEGECVFVKDSDAPKGNFAMVIKEQAYN
ncbi:cell division protein FtsL [Ihubacter sp. rT4E-8]|uniref:cell division protein FtsL n=1 Tax=unclassified Ihubacter TaxID=2633299 RepID=UPI00137B3F9F